MSFRTRLTSFFVLIVVVPMAAVGFLVFRLIDDSQSGKADARASAVGRHRRQRLRQRQHRRRACGRARWPATSRSPRRPSSTRAPAPSPPRSAWRVSRSAVGDAREGRHRRPHRDRPRDRRGQGGAAPGRLGRSWPRADRGRARPRPRRLGHPGGRALGRARRWPRRCPRPPGARCRTRAGRSRSATRPTRWSRETFTGFDNVPGCGVDPVQRAGSRAARSAPIACWRGSSSPASSSWPSSSRCCPHAHCTASSGASWMPPGAWPAATSPRPCRRPAATSSPCSARSSTTCRASSSAGSPSSSRSARVCARRSAASARRSRRALTATRCSSSRCRRRWTPPRPTAAG